MERSWVERLADDLAASRAELAGLAVLLLGGIVLAVVVVGGVARPTSGPGPAGVEAASAGWSGAPVLPSPSAGPPGDPLVLAAPTPDVVVVHVTGAVATPAVVELPGGSRLVDAVDAVGGPSSDAALDALNLAQLLADGQRLHVPTRQEVAANGGSGMVGGVTGTSPPSLDPGTGMPPTAVPGDSTGPNAAVTTDGLLDLNRATVADLEDLPGVGPVLAGRIVAWRDEHGSFAETGQLREVTGIGEARFQDLAPLVTIP